MFPWVDGFHWTPVHITFLTLFFTAVVTVSSTFIAGVWRTINEFRANRAGETAWRLTFARLPEEERHCRHELAGRVASRICDNAFDCRNCQKYAELAALPAQLPSKNVGVGYSNKLLYHRGHTWVRPERDGTYTIGLDDFAQRLIGHPDAVELPPEDSEIESEGIAWRMRKNGHEIRVRAPLGGTVICTGGEDNGWCVNVLPHGPANLRHLLTGDEIRGWLTKEIDRLQMQLSSADAGSCLADGGILMANLMDVEPNADWDTVLATTFLDN